MSLKDMPWWVYLLLLPLGIIVVSDIIVFAFLSEFAQNFNPQIIGFSVFLVIVLLIISIGYLFKKNQKRNQRKFFEGMNCYQECVVQFKVGRESYFDSGKLEGEKFLKFFEAFQKIHFLALENSYTPRILTRFPDLNTDYKEKGTSESSSLTSTYVWFS